jgi:signal-transduction protein with cAMP-binding, CBS, and nucleotidyltransferase domain
MDVQWVSDKASAADAACIMRDRSLGFLLVCDGMPSRLVGVVTDRDLALRVCAEGASSTSVRISDVMSYPVVTCAESDDLSTAEDLMQKTGKERLVVLNEGGTPSGVLTLTDILMRDRVGRALQTARGILSRESGGAHQPIEDIHLVASTAEDEDRAAEQTTVALGGHWGGSTKEFP